MSCEDLLTKRSAQDHSHRNTDRGCDWERAISLGVWISICLLAGWDGQTVPRAIYFESATAQNEKRGVRRLRNLFRFWRHIHACGLISINDKVRAYTQALIHMGRTGANFTHSLSPHLWPRHGGWVKELGWMSSLGHLAGKGDGRNWKEANVGGLHASCITVWLVSPL